MLVDRQRVTLQTSRERFARAAVSFPSIDCWILFSDKKNWDLFDAASKYPHRHEFGRTTIGAGHSMRVSFTTVAEFNEEKLHEVMATMRPAGAAVRSIQFEGDVPFLHRRWSDGFYEWLAFLADRELQSGELDRWIPLRGPQMNWSISWEALRGGTDPFGVGEWFGEVAERARDWIGNPPQFFEIVIRDVLTMSIEACDWLLEGASGWQNSKGILDQERRRGPIVVVEVNKRSRSEETKVLDPETEVPPDKLAPFSGGQLVFFRDRVELCGVCINSGRRSTPARKMLNLLRRKNADAFACYSGKQLAKKAGIKGGPNGVAGVVRDLRRNIEKVLRLRANIECELEDVILSGGPGYRLSDKLSVQDAEDASDTPKQDHIRLTQQVNDPIGDTNEPDFRPSGDSDEIDPNVSDDTNDPNPSVSNEPVDPNASATDRRAWILGELRSGRRLRVKDIVLQFGCSVPTAKRDWGTLKEKGLVVFVGNRRNGYYQSVGPDQ